MARLKVKRKTVYFYTDLFSLPQQDIPFNSSARYEDQAAGLQSCGAPPL